MLIGRVDWVARRSMGPSLLSRDEARGLRGASLAASGRCALLGARSSGCRDGWAARSRLIVVVWVAVLVFCGVGVGQARASAWTSRPVVVPVVSYGELSAVSCTSPRACTAVGSVINSAGVSEGLIERWDGLSWTIENAPGSVGGQGVSLAGVSCRHIACLAVGSLTAPGGETRALVERWNGSSWSIQSTPAPVGGKHWSFAGVSCSAKRTCVAVGSFTRRRGGARALIERWSGSRWKIQHAPRPARASDGFAVAGVSCASQRACMAIGQFDTTSGTFAMALRWNGSTWRLQRPVNYGRASEFTNMLSGVSCASANVCVAVGAAVEEDDGSSVHSSGDGSLVERWNGSRWSIQRHPFTERGPLRAVSCTSPRACIAVGDGLEERWNGSKWRIQRDGGPFTSGGSLTGVSCPTKTSCLSVGSIGFNASPAPEGDVTVSEQWNGSRWMAETTAASVPASGALTGVSCISAAECTAVGWYVNGAGVQVTIAERWNGSSWSLQSTPNQTNAGGDQLTAVSCTSATFCLAVGDGSAQSFSEIWNGTVWTLDNTIQPSEALDAVSCTSANACTAVGFGGPTRIGPSGLQQSTVAEHWNGLTWTIQSTPNANEDNELAGVSCPSANTCVAVGSAFPAADPQEAGFEQPTLIERWNGSSWSIQPSPPSGGALNAVSCTSATACTAVGDEQLTDVWDGSSWMSENAMPGPESGPQQGISCTSATACAAVSADSVAQTWNGAHWTAQTVPTPTGAAGGGFDAVSCTLPLTCMSVGGWTTAASSLMVAAQYH